MRQSISLPVPVGIATAVIMAVLGGCAQPPVEQLEAADKAVEVARAAGAAEYARDDLAKLEQEFALAKEEFTGQEKVLTIFQSFSDAEELLEKVVEDGKQVAVNAAQNKEKAKSAALAIEQEAKQVVASAKEFMSKTPIGKERASGKVIKKELAGLETNLRVISLLIEKGDYIGAERQARTVYLSPSSQQFSLRRCRAQEGLRKRERSVSSSIKGNCESGIGMSWKDRWTVGDYQTEHKG